MNTIKNTVVTITRDWIFFEGGMIKIFKIPEICNKKGPASGALKRNYG